MLSYLPKVAFALLISTVGEAAPLDNVSLPLGLAKPLLQAIAGAVSSYAPVKVACPSTPLVRAADGLSTDEAAYRTSRKQLADAALQSWLTSTNAGFKPTGSSMPTLGLTTSGGGYRTLLVGAGVIQGMDNREGNSSLAGLFQAMTYQAGLSGGGWLLSSMAGNNYPTITDLKERLWKQAFRDSLLLPADLLSGPVYAEVIVDIVAKDVAGFPPVLTDPWGRLLSHQLLPGVDGSAGLTMSKLATMSNFTSANVPYPIITALGVKTFNNECMVGPNATTYEFSPYEFGSWDRDVSAFTRTAYLGTSLEAGQPTGENCTMNYDNLGYVLGTSSTLFNEICTSVPDPMNTNASIANDLTNIVSKAHNITTKDLYARYPNPFYKYQSSTQAPNSANLVSAQQSLDLVDGGEALQNNPIWPMLQPARQIDVLFVNDNSADTAANYPNGSEILTTYVQSISANLTRMPYIPSVDTFVSQGLAVRPTFFGCNDTSKITIIYIPNRSIAGFNSGVPTAQFSYPENQTDALIANGAQVAANTDDPQWGTCVGCAIMAKTNSTLPDACPPCLQKYCYAGQ